MVFTNIPEESQTCYTVAYVQNGFSDTVNLTWIDKFSNTEQTYLTWSISLAYDQLMDVQWRTQPLFSSGVQMHYSLARNPNYYEKLFVIPSIIFVVLAYITFWISKDNPAARVLFSITNILNAISFLI